MMKKIVMAVTNDLRFDNRVRREALALSRAGFNVTIICKQSPYTPNEEVFDGVTVKRIDLRPYPRSLFKKFWILFRFLNVTNELLFHALLKERADIYHAHDFETLLACGMASQSVGAKLVYDVHDLKVDIAATKRPTTFISLIFHPLWIIAYRYIERTWARHAHGIVTTNKFYARILQNHYSVQSPTLVTNCPPYQYIDRNQVIDLRNHFSLPRSSKIILYQGGLGDSRGILPMIEAMKLLPEEYHFIIIGEGPIQDHILQSADRHQVAQRVHLHPFVKPEVLLRYTAGADIGLLLIEGNNLSKKYTAPNKLFEYMMTGLPILSSNMPFISQIIEQERIGVILESFAPAVIAAGVRKLSDTVLMEQMRQRALNAAKQRFNWEIESKNLVGLYQKIATA